MSGGWSHGNLADRPWGSARCLSHNPVGFGAAASVGHRTRPTATDTQYLPWERIAPFSAPPHRSGKALARSSRSCLNTTFGDQSGHQARQRHLRPDLFDRPDVRRRASPASRRRPEVPNAERRHIRLVGQSVTLSRTPSKMAARPLPSQSGPALEP